MRRSSSGASRDEKRIVIEVPVSSTPFSFQVMKNLLYSLIAPLDSSKSAIGESTLLLPEHSYADIKLVIPPRKKRCTNIRIIMKQKLQFKPYVDLSTSDSDDSSQVHKEGDTVDLEKLPRPEPLLSDRASFRFADPVLSGTLLVLYQFS
jgi:hypothetical protein